MSHSSVIGNTQHWELHTTPQPHKNSPQFPITGDVSHRSAGVHIPYYSRKRRKCISNKSLPPASSARSSSLVKIFWNLRSNFCLCGWSILLWFVLTTVTLNLRNKMMAMVPLTVFSWIQSQIGDEWDEKALGWPSLWTSQKLLTHSRGCPQKPRREKIPSWHLCSSGFLSFYKWTFFLFPAGWGGGVRNEKVRENHKI